MAASAVPGNLETVRAREFAEVSRAVYLNHAASAPLPARSAGALRSYSVARQRVHELYQQGTFDYDPTRLAGQLARLLRTDPGSIGFVPSTCDGIAAVLNGLDWKPGDNVVLSADEFPGVVYPCQRLRLNGIEARLVDTERGHLSIDRLIAACDRRTRAVAVSHVHWQTGFRADLARLGRHCRAAGIITIVDAIQSLGALPLDPESWEVDAVVAGSYKWLLAVPGVAVLYLRPELAQRLTPDRVGWTSMATSVHGEVEFEWHPDVRRFQTGGLPDPALLTLEPSVDLILEVGPSAIVERIDDLVTRLRNGLERLGCRINSAPEPESRSGILSFSLGSAERDQALVIDLRTQGIIVSHRGPGIRVAPHFHNSDGDIDRLLAAIR